jgi:hypothetical protein
MLYTTGTLVEHLLEAWSAVKIIKRTEFRSLRDCVVEACVETCIVLQVIINIKRREGWREIDEQRMLAHLFVIIAANEYVRIGHLDYLYHLPPITLRNPRSTAAPWLGHLSSVVVFITENNLLEP